MNDKAIADLQALIQVARRKSEYDKDNSWFKGSKTYLNEIKNEVDEVFEEIPKHRTCYLEDELGDVLWDYLNAVIALENEADIKLESVLNRACQKYEERVSAIEQNRGWSDVKEVQKARLNDEFQMSVQRLKN